MKLMWNITTNAYFYDLCALVYVYIYWNIILYLTTDTTWTTQNYPKTVHTKLNYRILSSAQYPSDQTSTCKFKYLHCAPTQLTCKHPTLIWETALKITESLNVLVSLSS